MDQGFFLAQKQQDGSPGRPLGNEEDGAIMMWENLSEALNVRNRLIPEMGVLCVFRVNLVFTGEVIL